MKYLIAFLSLLFLWPCEALALQVKQHMQTSIGIFDATEQTLMYQFSDGGKYEIKTTLKTIGSFGFLYPFEALYNTVGVHYGDLFKPNIYYQEAKSRFNKRTKKIVYADGIPQYRISTKNEKKRQDKIIVDEKYEQSIDLLSTLGVVIQEIINDGKCDLRRYSFGGKHYSLSEIKTVGKEKIKTNYFEGNALKCEYHLEVLDDAEAGFLLDGKEPIYFWVLQDEKSKAYFVARVLVETTPFGKLESVTTKLEVIK